MRVTLEVHVRGMHFSGGAAIEVPELLTEAFKPISISDDHLLSFLAGEPNPQQVSIYLKLRQDAAKILVKELTTLLLEEMAQGDTYNGESKCRRLN